jgi:hypothetical protein
MAALTDRLAARARLQKIFDEALDQVIPMDLTKPLRGRTFREWEDQADEFDRTVTASLLQERAGLEDNAKVEVGGRCPHCGSEKVYLEKKEAKTVERQTPHGVVVLSEQRCRCRSCDRTFSPSGP